MDAIRRRIRIVSDCDHSGSIPSPTPPDLVHSSQPRAMLVRPSVGDVIHHRIRIVSDCDYSGSLHRPTRMIWCTRRSRVRF